MADLSLRELILLDVLATLATITTGNGYATTLGRVTRGMLSPLETYALPLASVLPVDDRPDTGAQVYRRMLSFTVRLWVDDAPAESPATLEALLADVQQALQVDSTRSGHCEYTLEGQTSFIYNASTERLAGADIEFMCDYKSPLGQPRVSA